MKNLSFASVSDPEEAPEFYRLRVMQALGNLDMTGLALLLAEIRRVRKSKSTIFVAGNGGSASTASHIAIDWMLGTGLKNPSLRVVPLSESSASITATGNDISFDQIFARQLQAMANKDDLLIVISASGNSSNLLTLTAVAKKMGLRVAALTGFDGGKLFALAHVNVNVPTAIGDYGVSEDLHLIIGHIVKEVLILEENNGK